MLGTLFSDEYIDQVADRDGLTGLFFLFSVWLLYMSFAMPFIVLGSLAWRLLCFSWTCLTAEPPGKTH